MSSNRFISVQTALKSTIFSESLNEGLVRKIDWTSKSPGNLPPVA